MATVPTMQVNGKTYYDYNGDGNWTDGLGAPLEAQNTSAPSSDYLQNVTAYDQQSGQTYNYNPTQYATPETAQRLGSELNLPVSQIQQEYWPTTDPMQQVGGLNAGLVNDTIARYGPATPGSYSAYLINRDLNSSYGAQDSYSNYYNSPATQQAMAAQQQTVAPPPAPTTPPPAGTTSGGTSTTGTQTKTGGTASNLQGGQTGLQVTPSAYNNAYEGTTTINGTSQRVAVLPDGRVFNASGQEITSQISPGDLASLRSAFAAAANNPAYQPASASQQTPTPGTGGTPAPTGGGSLPGQIPSGYVSPTPAIPPPSNAPPTSISPAGSPNYNPASTGFAYDQNPYAGGINPLLQQTGEGVNYQAQNDRNLALEKGTQLSNNLNEYTNQQYKASGDFQNLLNQAWEPTASGQGGYSQAQEASILQQPLLDSLQQTEGEAQQSYLTPQEQAGITGDTNAAYAQLGKDEAGINSAQNTRDSAVRGSLNQQQDQIYNALNSTGASVRGAYNTQANTSNAALANQAAAIRGAYGNTATNVNKALGNEGAAARSYLNPTALNVSQDYLNNYQFGDRDQQDIQDKAARTVGYGNRAAEDQLLQQANAAGNTSPLALAAARNRIQQTGAVNSADAVTDARIQAKQLALQTAQNRENTRLGAAQKYADLGTGTELNLGQQNVGAQQALGNQAQGAEQYLGTSALNTAGTLGAAELGAEQYLGSQAQQAQQFLGAARTGAEQTLGQSNINTATDLTKTNLAAGQQMDATNSQRAAELASNRQAAAQYNQGQRYTRGTAAYNAETAANKNFADTQLAQEQKYRDYLGGQQQQYGQNATIGNQQQIGAYGTQTGAVNSATGNSVSNAKTPDQGTATSITNTTVGALAALGLKRGGVTPGPHLAVVGEAGPELVINLPKIRHDEYGEYPSLDPYGASESDAGSSYGPSGISDIGQADDSYTGYAPPRQTNPLFKQLLRQRFGARDPNDPNSGDPNNPVNQQQQQLSMGKGPQILPTLLHRAIGFAEGGVVAPTDSYIAPGVEMVNGPQYRMLGTQGADAVLPLTPRKNNRVTPQMIPRLAEEFGTYGRS